MKSWAHKQHIARLRAIQHRCGALKTWDNVRGERLPMPRIPG